MESRKPKPTARKCEYCGKPLGVFAFAGHYLHPRCARAWKADRPLGKDRK